MSTRLNSDTKISEAQNNQTQNTDTPTLSIESDSPETTQSLGRRLGAHLQAGMILALCGDLGAGKTTLTQGIAQGLGITGPVTSPTFTFVNEYYLSEHSSSTPPANDNPDRHSRHHSGRYGGRHIACFYHIDLYRLPETPDQAQSEADTFGLDDIFDAVEEENSEVAVIIEWAERLGDILPADHLLVEIAHHNTPADDQAAPHRRTLTFTAHGPRSRALLETLNIES